MKKLMLTLALALTLLTPKAQAFQQIPLNDKLVKNYLAANADLDAISYRIMAEGSVISPALKNDLEKIAKVHGFASFAELDNVAANIAIVMAGIDSQTMAYIDGHDALVKELDNVKNDESIPAADRKQLVADLEEAIATTPELQYPNNIELIKRHYKEIEKSLM